MTQKHSLRWRTSPRWTSVISFLMAWYFLILCDVTLAVAGDASQIFSAAKQAYEADKFAVAQTLFTKGLSIDEKNALAYLYLGLSIRAAGTHIEDARAPFEMAIKLGDAKIVTQAATELARLDSDPATISLASKALDKCYCVMGSLPGDDTTRFSTCLRPTLVRLSSLDKAEVKGALILTGSKSGQLYFRVAFSFDDASAFIPPEGKRVSFYSPDEDAALSVDPTSWFKSEAEEAKGQQAVSKALEDWGQYSQGFGIENGEAVTYAWVEEDGNTDLKTVSLDGHEKCAGE